MLDTPTGAEAATAAQMAEILSRQRHAFLQAGPPTLADRRRDIEMLRDAVKGEAENFAAAISADFGLRSRHETMVADIWPIVSSARHTLKRLEAWMAPDRVSPGLELLPRQARILYQPKGVVGIISPWNYPVHLAIVPLIAALAAGNRVMLKPSELTPRASGLMAEMLAKLFPPEKVAMVQGDAETGAHFSSLPFDHLFFTGSTAVGRRVMLAAALNLTPVTLELGGKSPCLVGKDAHLAQAAKSIAGGKLLNAGQTCIAPDYVLIPQERLEDFIGHFTTAVAKLYPTLAENPDYTSIVNSRHYGRIAAYIEEARQSGARVIEINPAQESLPEPLRKMAPTLVIDPDDELAVMREEIFGPVLPLKTYRSLDEAIAYVNERPRPLAFYYFGADEADRDRTLARTTSGGVTVNQTLLHIVAENLPFGGIGESGMGAYRGEEGFRTFSHRKGVLLHSRFDSSSLLRPPYGRLAGLMLKFLLRR